ncbi:sensor histidine kinase [Phycisphaerales bacterium AB-hyl4]|uniref:histidine kinase n=1 Tax=Natronomicrosphaera hydrolytica TaxID=3242702 RepID=A0ABV4U0Z4_9BACT
MSDQSIDTRPSPASRPGRRWLQRGESTIATMSLSLAVILVATLLACGVWMMQTQRQTLSQARESQVTATADLLADACEALLSQGELTAARRMIMDASATHRLERARIVLPNGTVVADADAGRINLESLPEQWSHEDVVNFDQPTTAQSVGLLVVERPMQVGTQGVARLEIIAELNADTWLGTSSWEAQAGVGVIGAGGMLALLLTYRRFRGRLQAVGVIREALLAMGKGERAEAALAVADGLGDEAVAWNELLAERKQLREAAKVRTVQEALTGDLGGGDLAQACDAVSQGLLLVDDHQRIRYTNHAASVFLQVGREQMHGKAVRDVVQIDELTELIEQTANGQVRRKVTREIERDENDNVGVLRISVHPVRGSHGATAMVVLEDVTQQRVAEQSSRQFVAQATHELRTPLTNIRLYMETLIEDGEQVEPQTRAKCLNVINQETFRLERLVGDMLSVAEIEAGSMQIQQDDVRIDTLLNAIEAEYKPSADEKQIAISFKIPPKLPIVQGDRDKLSMALHNLVGNAIKYTPEGGRVNVSVVAEEEKLGVEVTDSGMGIAPEDQLRIFDRFYRAKDKRIAGITGSGLGLALAREVARLHGGDIDVDSQIDQGSTFTLTLPAREDAATATE